MKAIETEIEGVFILEPIVYEDSRGFFFESFNQKEFSKLTGFNGEFKQDNHSKSVQGVVSGLHFQIAPYEQGKLVRCFKGSVFDVIVDIRPQSLTFGKWIGIELTEHNKKQIWIPAGCAHGFQTVSKEAEFVYKTTEYYSPQSEKCILWDDETLNIQWPRCNVLRSDQAKQGLTYKEWQAEVENGNLIYSYSREV